MIGRRIAHYEITGELGAGGMGEVYRARDLRLKRDVAIKVLPESVSRDPALLGRFRTEAEILAALSHPHIGQIFGIEQEGEEHALVLEMIDGPSLEDRIRQGPLPLAEALRIAVQVASALEAAHERGIIHRDVKPGNILLTREGEAKLVDFGLAKGTELDASGNRTAEGMILGTPAYMSPEQMHGRPLDRRTDVWSFGCVLYEMVSGRRANPGGSVGECFAAIDSGQLDLGAVARFPIRLQHVIERCLRSDPRRRLRDVGDARIELEDLASGDPEERLVREPVRPSRLRAGLLTMLALAIGVALGAILFGVGDGSVPATAGSATRFELAVPLGLSIHSQTGQASPIAVSHDGGTVAFSALDTSTEVRSLYVRRVDQTNAVPLAGTENAEAPFFSPDGRSLGFLGDSGDSLMRLDLAEGSIRPVYPRHTIRGADWAPDDTIVFGNSDQGLYLIPAGGGDARPLTSPTGDEVDHRWPQFLPDGDHVLFTAYARTDTGIEFQTKVVSRSDPRMVLNLGLTGRAARYVSGGYLVFNRLRTRELWVVRFDLAHLKVEGEPEPLLRSGEEIHVDEERGIPFFAVSDAGLVYEAARPPSPGRQMVWVDRNGSATAFASGKGFEYPRISPSGAKVAVAIHHPDDTHTPWTYDIETGIGTPVTVTGNVLEPIWEPGPAEDVLICGSLDGEANLFRVELADGSTTELLRREGFQSPLSWVRDDLVLFNDKSAGTRMDVSILNPLDGSVRGLLTRPYNEWAATFSPDGEWLAWVSDESNRPEVYVRRGNGPKARISLDGGTEPVWSRTGDELFFRNLKVLYSVRTPASPGGAFGRQEEVFEGSYLKGLDHRPAYDVLDDPKTGPRFLMLTGDWGLSSKMLVLRDVRTFLLQR